MDDTTPEEMALLDFDAIDEDKDDKVSHDEFISYLGKAMRKRFVKELKNIL